jgi:hypothetical protein
MNESTVEKKSRMIVTCKDFIFSVISDKCMVMKIGLKMGHGKIKCNIREIKKVEHFKYIRSKIVTNTSVK